MNFLRDLPLKRKLFYGTFATCMAALILACSALFWFQSVQFRKGFVSELESLGAIIARNSAAPLAFGDMRSAIEVLDALKVKKQISSARVYDSAGKLFVHFGSDPAVAPMGRGPSEDKVTFDQGYAVLILPIALEDAAPGRLELHARFSDEYRKLLSLYAVVMALVAAGSFAIILLTSSALQRIIVGPIVTLSEVAKNISEREDYSVRAPEAGRDEVGALTVTFNQMLDQIQSRGARLQESQQRYEVAVQGSSDGIWDWDLVTDTLYFSPRWKDMLGYADTELKNTFDMFLNLLHPDDAERVTAKIEDYLAGRQSVFEVEFQARHRNGSYVWILSRGAALRDGGGKPIRFAGSHTDITDHMKAEKEMEQLNRQLRDASREAGMAEVATGVLHNVGNVLNSVNVSANLITEQVRNSKTTSLARAVQLLREHKDDVGQFLTLDPKGQQLPAFFEALSEHLTREQSALTKELQGLQTNIEHIKQIVAMQQSYAKVSGALDPVAPEELVEDAVRMTSGALARHQIELVRDYGVVPAVLVDRHKVLQILVNLVGNAKHALDARAEGRRLTFRIVRGEGSHVRVEVMDNGMGIPKENLTRIFNHGFTTKKTGHGFGLHSGANAARELGGSLTVHSDGPGHGATFILELPAIKNAARLSSLPTGHTRHIRRNQVA